MSRVATRPSSRNKMEKLGNERVAFGRSATNFGAPWQTVSVSAGCPGVVIAFFAAIVAGTRMRKAAKYVR